MSTYNVAAYSAGSSGATYFTAGSICAAYILSSAGSMRWLGLAAPGIALVLWLVTNDGHGVLLAEGFVAGLLLVSLCLLMRHRIGQSVHCKSRRMPTGATFRRQLRRLIRARSTGEPMLEHIAELG